MKAFFFLIILSYLASAQEGERASSTILLDEQGIKNLGITLSEAEERPFETTFFAIGRITEIPTLHSVLSSRISGRIAKVNAFVGDEVERGDTLVEIESRQAGNPPPVIKITSPRSGTVMESHITDGEPVTPDEEMLDIVDLSRVWAIARIPESAAGKLKKGTQARIRIPAVSEEDIIATLLRFGVVADTNAGTIDAIFELSNDDLSIRPGMRAEFSVITSSRPDVLSIPREAVQGDPSKRVVYIKDFELENAFVKSPIILGAENDRYVEVISGLFPGDEVVTRGSYFLGFVAGSDGPSLKEALDAAHGHEHNDDGSEMTAEDKKNHETESDHHEEHSPPTLYLIVIGVLSLLLIIALQVIWSLRQRSTPQP